MIPLFQPEPESARLLSSFSSFSSHGGAVLFQGAPEFIKETPECTYMFSWASALACVPVKTTSCSYK